MANVDSFSMSTMLNSLQDLRFAAARESFEEEFPAIPPPPRKTMIEEAEQVVAMDVAEEVEADWIGEYKGKGWEAFLMSNTKDHQQHMNVPPPPCDEVWTQELLAFFRRDEEEDWIGDLMDKAKGLEDVLMINTKDQHLMNVPSLPSEEWTPEFRDWIGEQEEVEGDWIGEYEGWEAVLMINTEDQHMNVPPLPSYEEWTQEFLALTRDEEDSSNTQLMDQD